MDQNYTNFQLFVRKIAPTMSENDLQMLSVKANEATFQKGDIFVKEGDICKQVLFIHQGVFRYYLVHEGQDITKDFAVDTLNPFCTAYTSFILQKPSDIWIEALESSRVWIWNRTDIHPLFQHHPAWLRFSKTMAELLFLRKEEKEIERLKWSAEERYRHFLTRFPGLSQRVAQYHTATYLGITPESLSRIRARDHR